MKTSGNLALAEEGQTTQSGDLAALTDSDLFSPFTKERVLSYLTGVPRHSGIHRKAAERLQDTLSLGDPGISPAIRPASKKERQDDARCLQKWEGAVVTVEGDIFTATLVDLTAKSPNEEAEFPIEEVSYEDRNLLVRGSIFYWSIGYVDSRSGQRTRASVIRFRRLPVWSEEEIQSARREAEQISESIGWK